MWVILFFLLAAAALAYRYSTSTHSIPFTTTTTKSIPLKKEKEEEPAIDISLNNFVIQFRKQSKPVYVFKYMDSVRGQSAFGEFGVKGLGFNSYFWIEGIENQTNFTTESDLFSHLSKKLESVPDFLVKTQSPYPGKPWEHIIGKLGTGMDGSPRVLTGAHEDDHADDIVYSMAPMSMNPMSSDELMALKYNPGNLTNQIQEAIIADANQ